MAELDKFEVIYDILDHHNPILCSQDKKFGYVRHVRAIAFSYPFIQLNSEYFIRTLSVDIDMIMTIPEIKRIAIDNNLPLPTFIVNTDKGHHVHWVLEKVVNNKNKVALSYAQDVQRALTWVYGADACAVGVNRVWRNPIQHKCEYLETVVNLKDFNKVLIKYNKSNPVKRRFVEKIDFSIVAKGERHHSMFTHLRNIAYRNSEKDLDKLLSSESKLQNSLMESPLSERALGTMIKSIVDFMETKFVQTNKGGYTAEYNRELASKKKDIAFEKVYNIILGMKENSEDYLKVSMKRLAKGAGVSWATAKKHYKDAVENLD